MKEIYRSERNSVDELIDVIEYLVILKRGVYTLRQLRKLYPNIKGIGVDSLRSIDIKNLIKKQLEGKVEFCMSKSQKRPVLICDLCRC